MKIRYKGGKTWYKIALNRTPYIFSVENNRTLDIKDQAVINYIFSLPNNAEFEAVMEETKPAPIKQEPEKNKLQCDICDFIAKSDQGLLVHIATKHKKGEK